MRTPSAYCFHADVLNVTLYPLEAPAHKSFFGALPQCPGAPAPSLVAAGLPGGRHRQNCRRIELFASVHNRQPSMRDTVTCHWDEEAGVWNVVETERARNCD